MNKKLQLFEVYIYICTLLYHYPENWHILFVIHYSLCYLDGKLFSELQKEEKEKLKGLFAAFDRIPSIEIMEHQVRDTKLLIAHDVLD